MFHILASFLVLVISLLLLAMLNSNKGSDEQNGGVFCSHEQRRQVAYIINVRGKHIGIEVT